ncbi:MAG: hypothetical protein JWO19_3471 [Bryobacterales bacterium]|jgi:hypothetical protein|nr:hypothetical protein [Bryobacterales bacterium]
MRADLKVYADAMATLERYAIAGLQRDTGTQFAKAQKRVDESRRAYEVARDTLDGHISSHGCA